MSETATKCQKVQATVDARVIAEFDVRWHERRVYLPGGGYRGMTPDEVGDLLQKKCKEFEEFMRDHRSQDVVSLTVERVVADMCSACKQEWDPTTEDGVTCCGYCGAEVPADA